MRVNWSEKEAENRTDYETLLGLILERNSACDPNTPFSRKLNKIYQKLRNKEELSK